MYGVLNPHHDKVLRFGLRRRPHHDLFCSLCFMKFLNLLCVKGCLGFRVESRAILLVSHCFLFRFASRDVNGVSRSAMGCSVGFTFHLFFCVEERRGASVGVEGFHVMPCCSFCTVSYDLCFEGRRGTSSVIVFIHVQ